MLMRSVDRGRDRCRATFPADKVPWTRRGRSRKGRPVARVNFRSRESAGRETATLDRRVPSADEHRTARCPLFHHDDSI